MRKALLAIFSIVVFTVSGFALTGLASASYDMKYYGYYDAPWWNSDDENTSSYSNVIIYSNCPLDSKAEREHWLDMAYNKGEKIICYLGTYFHPKFNESDDVWRAYLNTLKSEIGSNISKIWAFYLFDEPDIEDGFFPGFKIKDHPERVDAALNITKEIFPGVNTLMVFSHGGWTGGNDIVKNRNLDLVGLDPYFLEPWYATVMTGLSLDPFACGDTQKKYFDNMVKSRVFWVKSGGVSAQALCPGQLIDECDQRDYINGVVSSNTDREIVMVGQSYMCHNMEAYLNPNQPPSPCQQEWYFNFSINDPDITALLWYVYTTGTDYEKYLNYTYKCYGVGRDLPGQYNQNILREQKKWGLQIACNNQENRPFCANDSASYKNADQIRCNGKTVMKAGGSGHGLCDYACGADLQCNGTVPHTGQCDAGCKIIADICNNKDDDNDGVADEGCDDDMDTFWDSAMLCQGKYLAGNGVAYDCLSAWADLNDSNPKIGSEKCNNIDEDIDGKIDDGCDDDKDTWWDKDMACASEYLAGDGKVYACLSEWSDCDDENPVVKHYCGDFNGDNKVDIGDLVNMTSNFGQSSSSANWKSIFDVAPNGQIDIYDLVFVASRFT